MIVDLDSFSQPRKWQSRVCIIGGGIAGLTLAHSLRHSQIPVIVLEAGGLQAEDRCQDLNAVEMAGVPHAGTSAGRFRVLGGASTRWGGQLMPFTSDVLQPPAASGLPHWPITPQDIEPYYCELESLIGVNSLPFTGDLLSLFQQQPGLLSDDIRLRFSKWVPYRNRNLAKTLGQQCIQAGSISVFLHSNVTHIQMRADGCSVSSVTARTMAGVTHEFQADIFVACAGTIETSRLLLASNDVCRAGVGNDFDQVGRYFHDHISVKAATVPAEARHSLLQHFTPLLRSGTVHTPKLEASASLRTRKQMLSVMAHFPLEEPEHTAMHSVRKILRTMQSGKWDTSLIRTALGILPQCWEMGGYVGTAYLRNRRPVSRHASVALHIDCEQMPHPDSRIRLSSRLDRLGSRMAIVDWRISEQERHTMQTFAGVLNKTMHAAGFGQLLWDERLFQNDDSWFKLPTDVLHMMGGTRMGASPAESVVDANLLVHGVENLYVASCSVFPTGGSSNPTFSLMALTLRLSERIVRQCAEAAVGELAGSLVDAGV
jgi:choline dehydrogenase-like flavoprotein